MKKIRRRLWSLQARVRIGRYMLLGVLLSCGSSPSERKDILHYKLSGNWVSVSDASHTLNISKYGSFEYRNTNDFKDFIGFLELVSGKEIRSGSACKGDVLEVGSDYLKAKCPIVQVYKIVRMPFVESEKTYLLFDDEKYERRDL